MEDLLKRDTLLEFDKSPEFMVGVTKNWCNNILKTDDPYMDYWQEIIMVANEVLKEE